MQDILCNCIQSIIFDSDEIKIDELNITAKSNGEYLTMWQIPADIESGEYEMTCR